MRLIIIFLYLLLPGISLLYAQNALRDPILVTDLLDIKSLGSVTLTADGKRMAYTITSIVADEKNAGEHKYQSQVWTAHTTGSMPQQQFTTAPDGAGQPAWSPDGNRLAFVRGVEGKSQIFVASMAGGEPVQLTHFKYGASNPVWSPDGQKIAFTASINLRSYINDSDLNSKGALPLYNLEKPGMENSFILSNKAMPNANGSLENVRAYLDKNEQDNKAKVINKLNFQQEAATSSEQQVSHVFIMDARPGASPKAVTHGFTSFGNPQFVSGSPLMLVEGAFYRKYHPDHAQERGIYTVDTSGKDLKALVADSGYVYSGAAVSASGKWVALQKSRTGTVNIPELYVVPLDGVHKQTHIVHDRNKGNFTWSADDKSLYFTSAQNGGVVLYRYEMVNGKLTGLTSPVEGISSFDVKGNTMAYVKTAIKSPFELFVADANAGNERAVTRLNISWIKDKAISEPEKFSFKNELGQEVEYWVMKPAFYEPGKKYPVLLEIHGGPSGMWGPGESSMWHEYQYFCSKGYFVVYSNPRGSGGYGEAFLRGNVNDWGAGPASDVLKSLELATARFSDADTSRMVVTGGSYAGYLVAWIIAHDHRFKAACAQRGVYDLRTFFGEGNAWRLVPNYFGGYPWQPETLKILERESPINYVENINTPLIIFHGEQDLRTGVIQSEQLYKSLKVLGKPVEYVRHPGGTHELTRSGNNRQRIDQMLRTWEFFERFVGEGKVRVIEF